MLNLLCKLVDGLVSTDINGIVLIPLLYVLLGLFGEIMQNKNKKDLKECNPLRPIRKYLLT